MNATSVVLHPPASDHAHDVPLETAFDFLNTIELDSGALFERLTNLDDALTWLEDRGVLHDRPSVRRLRLSPAMQAEALARLIKTRDALRDVAHSVAHEERPDRADVEEVNRALRSRERIELISTPDGVRLGHSHVGDPLDDALARIAEPIAREIGEGHEDRIRICANDTCRWLFYDESRTGRRRWCNMATCGNRAKARRHRERAKAELALS